MKEKNYNRSIYVTFRRSKMKKFSSALTAITTTLLIIILATVSAIAVKLYYMKVPSQPDTIEKRYYYSVEPETGPTQVCNTQVCKPETKPDAIIA